MTEQNKSASTSQESPYPPPVVPYPQPYNGAYPPPPPGAAPYPPYFAYPPAPGETSHGENGQNGVPPAPGPYMMFAPPGVLYAYPPPPQGQPFPAPAANAVPNALSRPKRKQVKMACTNCAAACKRCDEQRPCERCQKYGIADSCVDGQRKERKKGIKRGPYKRKNKSSQDNTPYNGEWSPGAQPPPNPTTTAAAIHAVSQFAPPEGYYPVFYPPPYLTHPPDGQPGPDGSPPHPSGQPPMMPYYIHPGGYPPYHYPMYPPHGPPPPGAPGAPPPPQSQPPSQLQEPPQTVNPSDTAKKDDAPPADTNGMDPTLTNGKKRPRASKGNDPKAKKVKSGVPARNGKDKDEETGAVEGTIDADGATDSAS